MTLEITVEGVDYDDLKENGVQDSRELASYIHDFLHEEGYDVETVGVGEPEDDEDTVRVNVYKNGELVEEDVEKPVSTVEQLDNFTQYNHDANGGSGGFEDFRVERLDD